MTIGPRLALRGNGSSFGHAAKYLIADEPILHQTQLHPIVLLLPTLAFVVVAAGFPALAAAAGGNLLATALLVVVGISVILWCGHRVVTWWANRFVLTDLRVMFISGIWVRKVESVPLRVISGLHISYPVTLFRSLEFGSLALSVDGSPAKVFGPLPHVDRVYLMSGSAVRPYDE